MGCGRAIAALIGIGLLIGGCVGGFSTEDENWFIMAGIGFVMVLAAGEFRRGEPPSSDAGPKGGGDRGWRFPPPFLNRGRRGPG